MTHRNHVNVAPVRHRRPKPRLDTPYHYGHTDNLRTRHRRGEPEGPAAVRPTRSADERDHGLDPPVVEPAEHLVGAVPVEAALPALDLVPADREPHDVDAELVDRVEALAELAGAVEDVVVVLDAVLDDGRGMRLLGRERGGEQDGQQGEATHRNPAP